MFSSKSFIVSGLTFRSLIHLSLSLCMVLGSVLILSFISNYPVFPATFIEEAVFVPWYILASFVKNKVPIGARFYFWAFYLVPWWLPPWHPRFPSSQPALFFLVFSVCPLPDVNLMEVISVMSSVLRAQFSAPLGSSFVPHLQFLPLYWADRIYISSFFPLSSWSIYAAVHCPASQASQFNSSQKELPVLPAHSTPSLPLGFPIPVNSSHPSTKGASLRRSHSWPLLLPHTPHSIHRIPSSFSPPLSGYHLFLDNSIHAGLCAFTLVCLPTIHSLHGSQIFQNLSQVMSLSGLKSINCSPLAFLKASLILDQRPWVTWAHWPHHLILYHSSFSWLPPA